MPSGAYWPVMALKVAGKLLGPSSASVTSQAAAGRCRDNRNGCDTADRTRSRLEGDGHRPGISTLGDAQRVWSGRDTRRRDDVQHQRLLTGVPVTVRISGRAVGVVADNPDAG